MANLPQENIIIASSRWSISFHNMYLLIIVKKMDYISTRAFTCAWVAKNVWTTSANIMISLLIAFQF